MCTQRVKLFVLVSDLCFLCFIDCFELPSCLSCKWIEWRPRRGGWWGQENNYRWRDYQPLHRILWPKQVRFETFQLAFMSACECHCFTFCECWRLFSRRLILPKPVFAVICRLERSEEGKSASKEVKKKTYGFCFRDRIKTVWLFSWKNTSSHIFSIISNVATQNVGVFFLLL